jgi:SNF2 family DNA or RNA helicase
MNQIRFEEWLDENELTHEIHQKEAVEWCLKRENALEHKGGIIADEMGLGKTIEILGTIICNRLSNTLIVLPYSLLGQWTKIITKLFGEKPLVFHGAGRKNLSEEEIKAHSIVLTTFGLIAQKRWIDRAGDNPLYNIQWNRVVYDEAHHLRNKQTGVFMGALRIKTDITWLMTGTPIQNKAGDLYNLYRLLGFTSPVYIKENVEKLVSIYILRRTKEQTGIILPKCHSSIVNVEWNHDKEEELSQKIHFNLSFSNLPELHGLLDDSSESKRGSMQNIVGEHLCLIAKAKKMCVLPKLLKKTIKTIMEAGVIKQNPTKMVEMLRYASKLESVMDVIIERKNNGKNKLVFCYFHGEIDELERLINAQGMSVKKFDGRTSKKERAEILSETYDVLIGQIDAASEGLNLQMYKEVYIVSPHWNPAIEDQAIGRCHRIGQSEEVHVFRFIMNSFNGFDTLQEAPSAFTLDQHICNVQEIKRDIVKKLLVETKEKKKKRRLIITD